MSKDKYPNIFSPQMEAIVFIILQIFFATRAVLKIGEYPRIFPSFSWGIIGPRDAFRPIARERKYLMDYNGSYTMMAKPMKTLELHYPMIQFLIMTVIRAF